MLRRRIGGRSGQRSRRWTCDGPKPKPKSTSIVRMGTHKKKNCLVPVGPGEKEKKSNRVSEL